MYVDGYVLAVPTAKREAYRVLAEAAAAVFKDHGALSVVECIVGVRTTLPPIRFAAARTSSAVSRASSVPAAVLCAGLSIGSRA